MEIKLFIKNNDDIFCPVIQDEITWETCRKGMPGELKFKVLLDKNFNIEEGNAIKLKIDGVDIFSGFVFSRNWDKNNIVSITAYDQLRYLKNKDCKKYENKTTTEIIETIAKGFNFNFGTLENTGFKITSILQDNITFLDLIQDAIERTLVNTKNLYVFYDDFGKLTLKNISSMKKEILINNETAEDFGYISTIDSATYNRIKIVNSDKDKGQREVFIEEDKSNISKWGLLQYFDTVNIKSGENGKVKAKALLDLYNKKTRSLTIKKAFGDLGVRAGCLVPVKLDLQDNTIKNYMLIEKCTHYFYANERYMDLTLRGGEVIV